jgi:hypothetical protein
MAEHAVCQALEGRTMLAAGGGPVILGGAATFSISGIIYKDLNGDGSRARQDTQPVKGVAIYVDSNTNGRRDPGEPTAISATNGSYSLPGLAAGTHIVRTGKKTGLRNARPGDGSAQVVITSASRKLNFGFTARQRVRGTVFADVDADGVLDDTDLTIPGRIVFIDRDRDGVRDASEPAAETDSDGSFVLSPLNLAAGKYRLRTDLGSEGFTRPTAGFYTLVLGAGTDLRRDFGST